MTYRLDGAAVHGIADLYDQARRQLADLEAGSGPTSFDLVLQVFADHERIELQLR